MDEFREIDASDAAVEREGRDLVLTFSGPSEALKALMRAGRDKEVVRVLTSGDGIIGVPQPVHPGNPGVIRILSAY